MATAIHSWVFIHCVCLLGGVKIQEFGNLICHLSPLSKRPYMIPSRVRPIKHYQSPLVVSPPTPPTPPPIRFLPEIALESVLLFVLNFSDFYLIQCTSSSFSSI